ncbi:MAG: amidohydrolase [Planctomycetota bacterium]
MKRTILLLLLCAAALPMTSSPLDPGRDAEADGPVVLFHGGTIHTGFSARGAVGEEATRTEALLARGGRIVALGDFATLSRTEAGRIAERVDLRGGHAFPGFQDAHGHVENYGAFLEEVDLTGCTTFGELVRRVRQRAAELPAGTWVRGRGWDQTLWPGARFPHHAELSAAVPDHPVLVDRVDGHAALANQRALEAAGLAGDELPDDPVGGRVVRERGRATGVLVDTAIGLVGAFVPEPTEEVRRRRILRAQDALLAVGLTCVHDMGEDVRGSRILRALADAGELDLRVVGYVYANALETASDFEGVRQVFDEQDVFGVPGVKFMVDGALGSRGAALIDDYTDAPGERGLARFDADRFARQVELAARAGLQPATHAIGDRANRTVLDSYARTRRVLPGLAALRPRIEHAQVVAASDFARFGSLEVIASMQPTHATSDMRWAVDRLGERRARGAYAWRTLEEATPVPLAFGSDFPVERPHPLEGLYAALTRQDRDGGPEGGFFPEERLDARAALAAFTSGAAFAALQEDRRGRLALGYGCDLTVVDVDLSRLDAGSAHRALDASVLMTVVNGEVLYRAEPR